MIWTLKQCLSGHIMHFFKIISNTLLISMIHVFRSLNIKESKKKNIMHQLHEQPPQIRRIKKTMI